MQHLKYKLAQTVFQSKMDGGVGVIAPDKPDEQDFLIGFWSKNETYTPKYTEKLLPHISIKNQTGRNTCTFESAVGAKEMDEGKELSVRSVVAWAEEQGFISGDGFSSLKASQQALQKFGAADASLVDDRFRPWTHYSSPHTLTDTVRASAAKHKTKTYWKVSKLSEVYELIDNDRPVQIAMYWYTGYNMNGGLRAPWIIPYKKGYRVGAHACYVIGYKSNYHGEDVIIVMNSYGPNWGDNAVFYIKVSDFEKELDIFGGYTNLDVEKDVGSFLRDYNGEDVKTSNSPKVYKIEKGQKRHYVNIPAYRKHTNGGTLHIVETSLLNEVEEGLPIQ